jgi:hypothetical protein
MTRRTAVGFAAFGALALVFGAFAFALPSKSSSSATTPAATAACRSAVAGASDVPDLKPNPIGGPAAAALTGGPARSQLSLDGSGLVLMPPRADDHPTVSRAAAECAAMTSLGPEGQPVVFPSMLRFAGAAVGYARATVNPALAATIGPLNGETLPPPAPFQKRLVWAVVAPDMRTSNCPAMSGPTPAGIAQPTDFAYRVFLLDARTGADALVYTEGGPQFCGFPGRVPPSAQVPFQQVSVPWTLASRDRHNYLGTLTARVRPCERAPDSVNVDGHPPALAVVVNRPIAPPCGSDKPVSIRVQPGDYDTLPVAIRHWPLGPYFPPPEPTSFPEPQNPRMVGPSDNNTTITTPVKSQLMISFELAPTSGEGRHAVTNNPAVLDLVTDPNDNVLQEFRAFTPGEADLSIPGQWTLHVIVTP